jgi:hypothetical protein
VLVLQDVHVPEFVLQSAFLKRPLHEHGAREVTPIENVHLDLSPNRTPPTQFAELLVPSEAIRVKTA